MGYLEFTTFKTYHYEDAKKHQRKSKKLAVDQFIKLFSINRDYESQNNSHLLHGFELETFIIKEQEDSQHKLSYVLNNEADYLFEKPYRKEHFGIKTEALAAQIEVTPCEPYNYYLFGKPMLECYKFSYENITENLEPGHEVFLSSHFQAFGSKASLKFLGFEGMSPEEIREANTITKSCYNSDHCICKHPRYLTAGETLTKRRGEKVHIHLPLFKDEKTDMEYKDDYDPVAGYATLESVSSALSVTSIQVTFASTGLKQARWVHDQLHILAPLIVKQYL